MDEVKALSPKSVIKRSLYLAEFTICQYFKAYGNLHLSIEVQIFRQRDISHDIAEQSNIVQAGELL